MRLKFVGGPAEGGCVITAVLPGTTRWHVQVPNPGGRSARPISWWTIDREPPADDRLTITEYRLTSSDADADEGIVHTFTAV